MPTASFTKLKSGEWGLRIVGAVSEGALVKVSKRSGPSVEKIVGRIVWRGEGVCVATIAPPPSAPVAPAADLVYAGDKPSLEELVRAKLAKGSLAGYRVGRRTEWIVARIAAELVEEHYLSAEREESGWEPSREWLRRAWVYFAKKWSAENERKREEC